MRISAVDRKRRNDAEACREKWNRFSREFTKADDVDAYCDALMDVGYCLADHGMGGAQISRMIDNLVYVSGARDEPFICEE